MGWKKSLLIGLAAIMIYIWWQNFSGVMNSEDQVVPLSQPNAGSVDSSVSKQFSQLAYNHPKVNPFTRVIPSPTIKKVPVAKQVPQFVRPRLDPAYYLTGILNRGKSSQAVIRTLNQGFTVLSVRDSIGSWKLIDIRDTLVVFKNSKFNDTLFLNKQRN